MILVGDTEEDTGEIMIVEIVEDMDAEVTGGIVITKMTTRIIKGEIILQHMGITHTLNIHNIIVIIIVPPNKRIKNSMTLPHLAKI